MNTALNVRAAFVGLLLLAALPAAAQQKSAISDQGNFFSPAAIATAEQQFEEVVRQKGPRVRVETRQSVPAADLARVEKMSRMEKDVYFSDFMRQQQKGANPADLLLMVFREPTQLRLAVHPSWKNKGWSDAERKSAVDQILSRFRDRQFDLGLTEFATLVKTKAAQSPAGGVSAAPGNRTSGTSLPGGEQPKAGDLPGQINWSSLVMIGLLVFGGLFLVSMIARLFSGGIGAGGGGGGLLGGLMAGLGGAFLGHWLYDSFMGGSHADADDQNLRDDGTSGGDSYDSSGGDWGGGGFDDGGDF